MAHSISMTRMETSRKLKEVVSRRTSVILVEKLEWKSVQLMKRTANVSHVDLGTMK